MAISTTSSTAAGTYAITITGSSAGVPNQSITYTLTVQAASGTATTVSVKSISYSTQGGKHSDKDLDITIFLVNNLGNPVAGASVSITLSCTCGGPWYGTGTTGTDGTVTFKLVNAPSGSYTTTIPPPNGVIATGLTWDGITPANGFIKGSSSSSGETKLQ